MREFGYLFGVALFPVLLIAGGCTGKTASSEAQNTTSSSVQRRNQGSGKGTGQTENDPVQVMMAELRNLLNSRPRQASPADFPAVLENLNATIELSEKILAAGPKPARRNQARLAALEAITMASQLDPTRRELLEKIDALADSALRDTPNGPQAASVHFFRTFTHFNIERSFSKEDPTVSRRLFEMTKAFAQKVPADTRSNLMLYQIGESAMRDGQIDTAKDVFQFLAKQDLQGPVSQMVAGKLKLLDAIGNPIQLAGPTLNGNDFDITQYAGKVVLVDFWATWCMPCVAELPNVKAVYEKYHDAGFEVLGVSLDQSRNDLAKFVEDQSLPWPQIFIDEEGKRQWQNPIVQMYGIDGIPATFLVNREGKLQKFGARGAALEPAIVELLNGTKLEAD